LGPSGVFFGRDAVQLEKSRISIIQISAVTVPFIITYPLFSLDFLSDR